MVIKKSSYLLLVYLIFFTSNVYAQKKSFEEYTNKEIVNAIWKAEGKYKATYLYGIRSIPTYGNKAYARQICLNSVRNGRKRWIKAGRPYNLISYIGLRYCPPKAHKLNSNWVKNVCYFLVRQK